MTEFKKYKGYALIQVKDLITDMESPMLHNGCSRDISQLRAVDNLDGRVYVPYDYKEGDTTRSVSIAGNTTRMYGIEDDILIVKETTSLEDLDIVFKMFEDVEIGDMIPIKIKGLSDNRNLWVEVFEKKASHRTILAKLGLNYVTVDFYKQDNNICVMVNPDCKLDTMVKTHIDYTGK